MNGDSLSPRQVVRFPANLHLPKRFQSSFAASLERFLDVKRTLGRRYAVEAATLSHWDAFLARRYPQARKVRAEMFFSWTEQLNHPSPVVRRNRQRIVRNFLLYYALLCCDEKSQIQALQRSQPGLPLGKGHIRTQTHDYYRNGTVTLFAALDYLQGKNIAHTARKHTHRQWLEFLKEIDRFSLVPRSVSQRWPSH